MSKTVFLAGATGAIGRRLALLLRHAGYRTFGTTRDPEKAGLLRGLGVEPVVVDMYDREGLSRAMLAASPEIVIHQLTDLPPALAADKMAEALVRNARLRQEGTANLVAAAAAAGASRLIAQSIAWVYAAGPEPHQESDPLDSAAPEPRAVSIRGVIALEEAVLGAPMTGIVLRYGNLYGPGTGRDAAPAGTPAPLHVDAAAHAALIAIGRGKPGAYNIAEENALAATGKARAELGFDPAFRIAD